MEIPLSHEESYTSCCPDMQWEQENKSSGNGQMLNFMFCWTVCLAEGLNITLLDVKINGFSLKEDQSRVCSTVHQSAEIEMLD